MDAYRVINFLKADKLSYQRKDDIDLIKDYFVNEDKVIYEHNWVHLLIYNGFDKEIYYVDNNAVTSLLLLSEESLAFFSPKIKDLLKFGKLITEVFSCFEGRLTFQSVSESWLKNNTALSQAINFITVPRSLNEVIYSTEQLVLLQGKDFSKLRLVRNSVLKSQDFLTKSLDSSTLQDALKVLEVWQRVQGIKYQKNKYDKEKFVLEKIAGVIGNESGVVCEVAYFHQQPVGYLLLVLPPVNKDVATIYLLKGLNRSEDGGHHGITDAIYLHVFDLIRRNDILYANDGDLGTEQGTINHKLRFAPIDRYRYFDLRLI